MLNWNIIKHSNCVCCLSLYNEQHDTAFNMCHMCKYNNHIIDFHYTYKKFIQNIQTCLKDYISGKYIDNDYYSLCNILIKYRLNVLIINKKIFNQNIDSLYSYKYNHENILIKKIIFKIFKCIHTKNINNRILSSIINQKMIEY